MKLFKKNLARMSIKMVCSIVLFLGSIVLIPTSLLTTHQPKCPDDLLM